MIEMRSSRLTEVISALPGADVNKKGAQNAVGPGGIFS